MFLGVSGETCGITSGMASMKAAPSRCMTPSTRCEAKKRSATMPRNSGETMAAMGQTVNTSAVRSPKPALFSQPVTGTYHAPQMKNWRNIMADSAVMVVGGVLDEVMGEY